MSNTDLLGRPLSPAPEFRLSIWQKRQATLLYHFASLDYLKGLKKLLDDFVRGVDITLDLALRQGRDQALANARWGVRDTASNFGTFGFPALTEFQKSVNKQIAQYASEYLHGTGYNQCARLLREMSLGWTTPDEQAYFEKGMGVIGTYAGWIDTVMQHRTTDSTWNGAWPQFAAKFPKLPKFRVRTDVGGESGRRPVRTGVYVPQDDALGSLQFAWTGNSDGDLFDCTTFNDIGLKAYQAVGRDAMYTDHPALLPVANESQYRELFKKLDWFKEPDFLVNPHSARRFVAREGFTTRPCKWYYVERVEGEFDDEDEAAAGTHAASSVPALRCEAGSPCPREGWWITPAQADGRRRFKAGEVMPLIGGDYGATIWQWDTSQEP